jgi:hypothetical protein
VIVEKEEEMRTKLNELEKEAKRKTELIQTRHWEAKEIREKSEAVLRDAERKMGETDKVI